MHLARVVTATAPFPVLLVLAACGGGSSDTPAPVASAPVIASFTATPSFVTAGGSSTLAWSVTGAKQVSIAGIGPVTGSNIRVTPAVRS